MEKDWVEKTVKARILIKDYDLPEAITIEKAYHLQDAYVAGIGKPVGGYKLAINGPTQKAYFGVSEGASARVFLDEIHYDGVTLPRSRFGSVSVEPELCAVLNSVVLKLDGPVDRHGAIACIDRFHAAIEVVDQRSFTVPQLTLEQAIALNIFNAGIVMGEKWIYPRNIDPETLRATLKLDDKIVGDVTGAAPQEPVEAVQWLINHCIARGIALEPGMIIMCGTHIPLQLLKDHVRKVEIAMTGLGSVTFFLNK